MAQPLPLRNIGPYAYDESGIISVCLYSVGAFYGAGKLQSLDLCDNQLIILDDGTFSGLHELERLDVSSNQLVELAPRALAPVAGFLIYLNLFKNQLQIIDFQSLAELDRLAFVGLENNSWTCNCSLWLPVNVGSQTLRGARDLIVCEHPPDAQGKLLSSVLAQNYTDNCSPYTERPTRSPPFVDFVDWRPLIIAVVMAVSLSVAAVSCLMVYRKRREVVWAPCHDTVDGTGSSESSSLEDSDQKIDGVAVVAGDAAVNRVDVRRPSLV